MGEPDIVSKYIKALMQFTICLQDTLALLGKGSTTSCNKFHVSLNENFASASPSRTYVPYINTATLHLFVNSPKYGQFSY